MKGVIVAFILMALAVAGCTQETIPVATEEPLQQIEPPAELPEDLGEEIGDLDEDYLDEALSELEQLE